MEIKLALSSIAQFAPWNFAERSIDIVFTDENEAAERMAEQQQNHVPMLRDFACSLRSNYAIGGFRSVERQERLALLIDAGLVEPELRNKPDEEQARAILTFEMIQKMGDTPLLGDLPLQSAPDSTGFTNTKQDIHVG
jgi:hypothetical protein